MKTKWIVIGTISGIAILAIIFSPLILEAYYLEKKYQEIDPQVFDIENCQDTDQCIEWFENGTCHMMLSKRCVIPEQETTTENVVAFDYEIKKDDVTYGSQYMISGGIVDDIGYDENSNSLIISLGESEKGYIQIVIQIGLLHSLEESPFTYFVIVDGEEATFEQLSPIYLKIPFEKRTKQIEIIGANEI